MLNEEQIQYLLAGTTGGTHDGETFTGNIHLVEKVGLQIRNLQNGGYMEKADAIAFLVGIRNELQVQLDATKGTACVQCKRPFK
jgi:hypothetical protein